MISYEANLSYLKIALKLLVLPFENTLSPSHQVHLHIILLFDLSLGFSSSIELLDFVVNLGLWANT